MNVVLVHGGWCGGWWMTPLADALRRRGARVFAPTLTGLGERLHLATPDVGLETHIQDVLGVLYFENLDDVILVGHSYGGMVVTGAADRARERIRKLIYLDAFVPADGECLFDFFDPEVVAAMKELTQRDGDGWQIPFPFTWEQVGITDPEFIEWNERGNVPHPLKSFAEPVSLRAEPWAFPVGYIYCETMAMGLFEPFRALARARGWECHDAPLTHADPAVKADETADWLMRVAKVC